MTIDEIFSHLSEHMVEGLMIHSQMSNYYNFLGLDGYKECHKYHYYSENKNYAEVCDYYLKHYNKIPMELPFNNPNVIPENWYRYKRQDVDPSIVKAGLQQGFDRWILWEKDTKATYQSFYQELCNLGEVAAAIEVKKYIKDVDDELAHAEQEQLKLKAIDYNLSDVMMMQDDIKKKYKKKLREMEL